MKHLAWVDPGGKPNHRNEEEDSTKEALAND